MVPSLLVGLFCLATSAVARLVPLHDSLGNVTGQPGPLLELQQSPADHGKDSVANHTLHSFEGAFWTTASDEDDEPTAEELWCRYVSRGTSLMKAMMMNEDDGRVLLGWPYVQSPWVGDMRSEMRTWGYLDTDELHQSHDTDCDFAVKHGLESVFRDSDKLNVDPRSAGQGGPNHCFYVQHSDSPVTLLDEENEMPFVTEQRYTVNDVEYRATDAHSGIGVNPIDGLLYFLDRSSPEQAAKELWGRRAAPSELPALRSSSDLAFAFWNRVANDATRTNVKYILSCQIINEHTEDVIERALEAVNAGNIQVWPGTDLDFAFAPDKGDEIEAALALLGSPNGLGAGYFLVQHKLQLGWKYISKVRIFRSPDDYPYVMFYVTDHAPWGAFVDRVDKQLMQVQTKREGRARVLVRRAAMRGRLQIHRTKQ